MSKAIFKVSALAVLIVVFCGWGALGAVVDGIWQMIVAFFPWIWEGIKYAVEEYITSPYFITGAIMMVASGFGIWFGARGGKVLYLVVSIIGAIASLASMGVSLI